MQKYKDYIVAIYSTGDVISMSHATRLPQAEVRYLVRCQFVDSTYSGENAYYKNLVYTPAMDKVEGNKLQWEGIECVLEENEKWSYLRGSWKSMLINFSITDKLGVTEQFVADNAYHNGCGFKVLMKKLRQLAACDTHKALRLLEAEEIELEKLTKKITKQEAKPTA